MKKECAATVKQAHGSRFTAKFIENFARAMGCTGYGYTINCLLNKYGVESVTDVFVNRKL